MNGHESFGTAGCADGANVSRRLALSPIPRFVVWPTVLLNVQVYGKLFSQVFEPRITRTTRILPTREGKDSDANGNSAVLHKLSERVRVPRAAL